MFLVIEAHLSCFGHLLRLIKVFRKFVLFDLFLSVQTDAGAEEMRAKTKGVKECLYYIDTVASSTGSKTPYIGWKRYVYLSLHMPCAISTGRAAARTPRQQQGLRSGCVVLQAEGRLWAGV